jgi:hypothetical protein
MVVPKPVVKVIALAIVILLLVPVVAGVSVPRVLAEDVAVGDVDRSKLIMLAMIALLFSDIPLDQVERCELFNTLYIYRNGSVELVKSPYLPGDLVLNMTRIVAEIKRSTNISYAVSEGRVDVYINGLLAYSIVYGENSSSWSLWVGELRNKSIDSNTVMYWRWVRANFINNFVDYYAIYLVRNVSDTHRIYIARSVLASYAMGERDPRKLALDAAVGFVSGFIGGFTGGLQFGLKPTGIARAANYIWNVQVSIWINSVYTALATLPQQFLQSFGLGTLVDMLISFLLP